MLDKVTYAVRRSSPPKQMLVVIRSPVAYVLDRFAVGRDRRDPAVEQRGHADVPVTVDGERVEQLHAGEPVQAHRCVDGTGSASSPGATMARRNTRPVRLGPVQLSAVGRQTDAVRLLGREHDLTDLRAVRLGVVDRRQVRVRAASSLRPWSVK